jgi:hypothetical protein
VVVFVLPDLVVFVFSDYGCLFSFFLVFWFFGFLVLIFGFLFFCWKGSVCVLESKKKWIWFLGFFWGCYPA